MVLVTVAPLLLRALGCTVTLSSDRLVGEGLNPEKINIKAFFVSIDAEWYHE